MIISLFKGTFNIDFLADYSKWYKYYGKWCREFQRIGKPLLGLLWKLCSGSTRCSNSSRKCSNSSRNLGISSCYIGDIMEQKEYHKTLFNLPEYVFPVAMLTLGYYRRLHGAIKREVCGKICSL